MATVLRLLLPAAALVLAISCDSPEPEPPAEDDLVGDSDADGELGKADGSNTFTYFVIQPDDRKCVSPLCGGYWVSRVNRAYTHCADGSWNPSCYVADLDFEGSGLADHQIESVTAEVASGKVLLRGDVGVGHWDGFGELGRLQVSEAWMGGSDSEPGGLFVRVTDSGLVCITAPCYGTLHEDKLNSVLDADLSELDLSWTDVEQEEQAGAFERVFSDDGLIVAGWRYWWYDGGWQRGRVAAQYYERIEPLPVAAQCVRGGCSSQLCLDESEGDIVTTCEWRPEYACYQAAACEPQPSGGCGHTPSPELDACLADAGV